MQTRSETIATIPAAQHAYPFLSQPPMDVYASPDALPQSHNTRRRSLAAISNWASNVQPGAPAPLTPPVHKSKFTEPAPHPAELRAARRHSVKPVPPPPVNYVPESPSSSDQSATPTSKPDFKADLQAPGYTSVYVQLPPDGRSVPTTPTSAAAPSSSRKGLARFRSLSLKPAARTKPAPEAASSSSAAAKEKKKEKKARYDDARPAQLATDLALAQLLGGGSMEHHIRQAAEKEARRAGAKRGAHGQLVGVADVHRAADGRVWRDADEELEYARLLPRERARAADEWVRFEERRGRAEASCDSSSASSLEHCDRAGKAKRRPEPLDLARAKPQRAYAVDPEEARRDFLQSSYNPAPAVVVVPAAPAADASASGKRSGLGLKSMFKKNTH